MSCQISQCNPYILIRDDTLRNNWIFAKKTLPFNKKYQKSGKVRPWLSGADCTHLSEATLGENALSAIFPELHIIIVRNLTSSLYRFRGGRFFVLCPIPYLMWNACIRFSSSFKDGSLVKKSLYGVSSSINACKHRNYRLNVMNIFLYVIVRLLI